MAKENGQCAEFSLVKGGLIYRLFQWAGLMDAELEPIHRRIIAAISITWVPLLVLSIIGGKLFAGADIVFANDIEHHVRFLVALPFLLAGETLIQRILSPRIKNFVIRKIIRESDMPRFRAAIESAHKMRDSFVIEIGIFAFVYIMGVRFYANVLASATTAMSTWYATPQDTNWNLTPAGYWLMFVSLPIVGFFLLRWYWRIVIWSVFLWRVSRLDLNLLPTHSDRTAGIGFLRKCAYGFSYGLFAQGAMLSGYIAGQVVHFGGDPRNYKLEASGLIFLVLVSVLGPLSVFSVKLITAKWEGGGRFEKLASQYVEGFDDKWIEGRNPDHEQLLGTPDLQSLADLGNSFSVIADMRTVPFGKSDVIYMAVLVMVPLIPLLLFIFSPEELLQSLVRFLM
jgi:hypothetical protein